MQLNADRFSPHSYGRFLDRQVAAFAAHFGARRKETERLVKFLLIGGLGVVVDFAALFVLQATILVPDGPNRDAKVLLATAISFSLAVLNNYALNRQWTFPESRSRPVHQQMMQFVAVSIVCGVVRTVFVLTTYNLFGQLLTPVYAQAMALLAHPTVADAETTARIGSLAAQMVGVAIVTVLNYLGNRYWTFRDVPA